MPQQRVEYFERFALEKIIGNTHVIPQPPSLLRKEWGPKEQADAIVRGMRTALYMGQVQTIWDNQGTHGGIRLNRSVIPARLRDPFHQVTLQLAAKLLARDAGISPQDVSLHKYHGTPSSISGPDFIVQVPDVGTAQKFFEEMRPPKLG